MKLRLGQPVHASDALFGELGDIVVDPVERTVTHLVVEPHHLHRQARLVPIRFVVESDDVLRIALSVDEIRRLQTVAATDFIEVDAPIDIGDDWDIGVEDVLMSPFYEDLGIEDGWDSAHVAVEYDRVPKGECEIRRRSAVVTADGHHVGHVDGFIADVSHVSAVVVRTGIPGHHHDVLLPMNVVSDVTNDRLDLSVTRRAFHEFPATRMFDRRRSRVT